MDYNLDMLYVGNRSEYTNYRPVVGIDRKEESQHLKKDDQQKDM